MSIKIYWFRSLSRIDGTQSQNFRLTQIPFSFFTDHGYDSEIYANDQLVSAAKYQQNSPPISGTHNSRYIGNSKVRIVIPDKMCTSSGHSKPRGQ